MVGALGSELGTGVADWLFELSVGVALGGAALASGMSFCPVVSASGASVAGWAGAADWISSGATSGAIGVAACDGALALGSIAARSRCIKCISFDLI